MATALAQSEKQAGSDSEGAHTDLSRSYSRFDPQKLTTEFPLPVTASIPDQPRPVPLTDWEAAVAYWLHLAEIGNDRRF